MKDLLVICMLQRLIRKEIHETLEDAAGLCTFLLLDGDDARSLDSETTFEEGIADLHATEDVHETQAIEWLPANCIVNFLTEAASDAWRNATRTQV